MRTTLAQATLTSKNALQDDIARAKRLPPGDRRKLVSVIQHDLPAEPEYADCADAAEVERAWAPELVRRANEVASGAVETEAWETVRDRIRGALRRS